jgi:hypothetical protein
MSQGTFKKTTWGIGLQLYGTILPNPLLFGTIFDHNSIKKCGGRSGDSVLGNNAQPSSHTPLNSFGEDVCGYLQVFRGFGCGKEGF